MEQQEKNQEESIFNEILKEENKTEKKSLFSGIFKKKEDNKLNDENKTDLEQKDNIFAEFSGGLDFGGEEIVVKKEEKKDKVFYLKKTSIGMFYLNIFLFISLVLFASYLYIQKSDKFLNNAYLDGICFIILGNDINNTYPSCSSVTSLYRDYNDKLTILNQNITSTIIPLLKKSYIIENFINSKEVSFLFDKNNNRVNVIGILNDFENLKNNFLGVDKQQIKCEGIEIKKDLTLKTTCEVYSSSWERAEGNIGIIGPSGDKSLSRDFIGGTSISLASSFLNFIEKNPKYNFEILNKQEIFSSEIILGEGTYVRKTKIDLELKYNNLSHTLSL